MKSERRIKIKKGRKPWTPRVPYLVPPNKVDGNGKGYCRRCENRKLRKEFACV